MTPSKTLAGYHSPVSPFWKCHKYTICLWNHSWSQHTPSPFNVQHPVVVSFQTAANCARSCYFLQSTLNGFPVICILCFPTFLILPVHLSLAFEPNHMHIGFFYFPIGSWLLFDSLLCLICVMALLRFSLGSTCRLSGSHWIPNACYMFVGSSPLGQLCTSNTLQW